MRRAVVLAVVLGGCGPRPGPWDDGAFLPAEPTASGDPEVGRDLLLNGDYMTCGIPLALWDVGDDVIAGALGGDADAPRLDGRTGVNADLPYNLNAFTTPDGVEVVNTNCLGCHGGMANGELVLGLGNSTSDWTTNPGDTAGAIPPELLASMGLTEGEQEQFLTLTHRFDAISPYAVMRNVGNNPAEGLAVALMLHHDRETLAWSDEMVTDLYVVDEDGEPILEPVVTSDPPPWWRAKKKHALFYNGMARGDQRGTMALATSVCVDTVDRAREVDVMFQDIHAFVLSIQAPAYPWTVDEALARKGQRLFERECAGCHGTYAEDATDDAADTYPNLLIPLDVIGTDPVVANLGAIHAPDLVEWYNGSFYGGITRMEADDPFPGYMPPPLDGIWATAPYLHNGSVPSIELLLNSGERPDAWKREDYDSRNFDQDAMGWPWEAVDDPDTLHPSEGKYVYDTRHWTQGNGGHTFGDAFSDDERSAVLEYLKTL